MSSVRIEATKVKVVSPPPKNWQVTLIVIEPKTKDASTRVFGLTSELHTEQEAERLVKILNAQVRS